MRYLGAVVALLAVLIVGYLVSDEESARASEQYDPEEVQFLHLLNHYRQNNGAEPLLLSDTLALSALHHSQDMAHYGFFSHSTAASSHYAAGAQPWDRMRAEGYDYNTLMAENIAVGCQTAERCFELWRNSPSHNAAMLDGRYQVIGIARVYVAGSVHGWYWTTDFGARVDPTSHTPAESSKDEEEEREEPLAEDGSAIENGQMSERGVWEQRARDGAELILEGGYARLGDYDNGRDDLRQKVRIREDTTAELSYKIKIETTEQLGGHPSDSLVVRLLDEQGDHLAVLKRYTQEDAGGGWRTERIDLSHFEGRRVYLSFLVETDPLLTTAFYLDGVDLEEVDEERP